MKVTEIEEEVEDIKVEEAVVELVCAMPSRKETAHAALDASSPMKAEVSGCLCN